MRTKNWQVTILALLLAVLFAAAGACVPAPTREAAGHSAINETSEAESDAWANAEEAVRDLVAAFDCTAGLQAGEWAQVVDVIDGDTIVVAYNGRQEKVRYIGLNAPEMDEPAGGSARSCNSSLLEGQPVFLLKDVSDTDQYGRLLRYVFTRDAFVNDSLIRNGCALQAAYPPDTACTVLFEEAEASARADALGLWEVSAAADGAASGIHIRTVFYDGIQGQNEPDEFVEIENSGDAPVELSGWYLKDQGSHRFIFPAFVMQPGQVCRVYTNERHADTCGFSFGVSASAVWNNGGDCAFLFTSDGKLVDEFCY